MELKIIFEDDTLLVAEKPAGIAVENLPRLTALGEAYRFGLVHRLDKDTSGLLLFAKTKEAFEFFQRQFALHHVAKTYVCLIEGTLKENKGTIRTFLGRAPGDRRKQKAFPYEAAGEKGKREAVTAYRVLERLPEYTLLEVMPKTGRKHQIRAHMAYLGHPVAGDKLYGFKNQRTPQGLTRQFLHATRLAVPMPDKTIQEFHSPLPNELKEVLNNLTNIHDKN